MNDGNGRRKGRVVGNQEKEEAIRRRAHQSVTDAVEEEEEVYVVRRSKGWREVWR